MPPAWSAMSGSGERCVACHGLSEGFVVSDNETAYFQALSTNRTNLAQYFRVDGSIIVINLENFQHVGTDQVPHAQHPKFTIDAGLPSLQTFYDLTLAVFNAGPCGPPRF
jgi:hypothetical protein